MLNGLRWLNSCGLNITDGQMNLNQDFQEFVELPVAHEGEFLIVGGCDLAVHGFPQLTKNQMSWCCLGENLNASIL